MLDIKKYINTQKLRKFGIPLLLAATAGGAYHYFSSPSAEEDSPTIAWGDLIQKPDQKACDLMAQFEKASCKHAFPARGFTAGENKLLSAFFGADFNRKGIRLFPNFDPSARGKEWVVYNELPQNQIYTFGSMGRTTDFSNNANISKFMFGAAGIWQAQHGKKPDGVTDVSYVLQKGIRFDEYPLVQQAAIIHDYAMIYMSSLRDHMPDKLMGYEKSYKPDPEAFKKNLTTIVETRFPGIKHARVEATADNDARRAMINKKMKEYDIALAQRKAAAKTEADDAVKRAQLAEKLSKGEKIPANPADKASGPKR